MPSVNGSPEVLARRFWAKVDRSGGPSACWPWLGARLRGAHGQLTQHGKRRVASRVAWELTRGPIPAGKFVCHRCDRGECCNPEHLFIGTQAENMRDAITKGRFRFTFRERPELVRGEGNVTSKLTVANVREIRRLRLAGVARGVVAKRFGVTPQNITHITNGTTWRTA